MRGKPSYHELQEQVNVLQEKVNVLQEEANELKKTEERYREIVQGTGDLVTEVDQEGRFTFVNEASSEIFGFRPRECTGKLAFDFIHPGDKERTERDFKKWIEAKKPCETHENRQVNRKNHEVRDMLWNIKFHYTEGGKISSIKSIARDITVLKKSEALFSATISSIHDGVTILDTELKILRVNPVIERYYGDEEKLKGKECFRCYRGKDKPCTPCPAIRALKSGQAESDEIPGPADTPVEWLELFAYPIRNHKDGPITGIVEFARDITDRKKAEVKLEKLVKERTQRLNRSIVEVHHRVKNNLHSIIGMLNMEQSQAEAKGQTSIIPVLQDLVGRVRGLSTVHTLLYKSEYLPLEINSLCEKVVDATLKAIPNGKQIDVDISPSKVKINSNKAHHLTMVINELTTNTMKYAIKENNKAKITINILQNGKNTELLFRDDGPGYPDEILNKMLDDKYSSESIGIKLILGFIRHSLQGEVTFKNDNGALTLFSFENTWEIDKERGEI